MVAQGLAPRVLPCSSPAGSILQPSLTDGRQVGRWGWPWGLTTPPSHAWTSPCSAALSLPSMGGCTGLWERQVGGGGGWENTDLCQVATPGVCCVRWPGLQAGKGGGHSPDGAATAGILELQRERLAPARASPPLATAQIQDNGPVELALGVPSPSYSRCL